MKQIQRPHRGGSGASRGRPARILIITPEITSLPDGMESPAPKIAAKGGGMADVAALLVSSLAGRGADVHVALPHYRRLFGVEPLEFDNEEWKDYKKKHANTSIHLAEDRSFYYRNRVYSDQNHKNPGIALAFQREVLNNILSRVCPDIIHCHDWMTGLVPAAARRLNIPCLFTLHNIHTERVSLAHVESMGIDAAEFWQSLYLDRYPENYEESREHNPIDLLGSGLFASDFINTVSPTFLDEIIGGRHGGIPDLLLEHLGGKRDAGEAAGILNAPHPSYNPSIDSALVQTYDAESLVSGKAANKMEFQKRSGLEMNPHAPLYFWPSRLDPMQKGCQLLTEILHQVISDYREAGLQIALVADGPFQEHFHDVVNLHGLHDRVAICGFDESLSRLGYAASDFTLVPSFYEPCGLAQMVAALYGSLPIVHRTGGLRDTVQHLNATEGTGNGFSFETPDGEGLRWAIDESMRFFRSDPGWRAAQVGRIMDKSKRSFDPEQAVERYLGIYENLAGCPVA